MIWSWLLIMHAAASFFMLGLVAAVQLLHYPMLAESTDITAACARHVRRAGPLIAPVMLTEALTGLALLASPFRGFWLAISLALLAIIWLSTFAIQVPIHRRLVSGRGDPARLAARLVSTNWLRTAAWAGRGLCVALLLASAL